MTKSASSQTCEEDWVKRVRNENAGMRMRMPGTARLQGTECTRRPCGLPGVRQQAADHTAAA